MMSNAANQGASHRNNDDDGGDDDGDDADDDNDDVIDGDDDVDGNTSTMLLSSLKLNGRVDALTATNPTSLTDSEPDVDMGAGGSAAQTYLRRAK